MGPCFHRASRGVSVFPSWSVDPRQRTAVVTMGKDRHLPVNALSWFCGSAPGFAPVPDFSDPALTQVCIISGPWDGENAVLRNGPNPSPGTTFVWQTENKTDAYAVYFQTEYQINDTWAITLGGYYSEDE